MLASFFVRGFRGIEETRLTFSKKTAIIGPNGSGKTHILEGIHIASGGSPTYLQAPRKEDAFFEFGFLGEVGVKAFSLSRHEWRDIYQIQWGKSTQIKYRENLPFRTVFISPFDMNLLYFAPGVRRDYLDSILARTFAQFSKVKRDYEGTMRQRNALLKKIREGEALRKDLDYWDMSFTEKACLYHTYRIRLIQFIESHSTVFSSSLGEYQISFVYESKIEEHKKATPGTSEEICITEYLKSNRERDILTGHTHIGPHLDDFAFFIERPEERVESGYFLSRGENKILLFSLKQIEMFFLKKYLDLPIILLFDDLLAELDVSHAESILEHFAADQIIITTPRLLPKSKNWDDFSCINLDPV